MVERERIVALVKTTYPFHKLDDNLINLVMESFDVADISKGEIIYREGFPSDNDSLCIIIEGKVRLSRTVFNELQDVITLTEGEMFGHEMLESNRKHPVSTFAETNVTLLKLDRARVNVLVAKIPTLPISLRLLYNSYLITLDQKFFWKGSNEIIHLVTRRHEIWLLGKIPLPLIILIFTLGLLAMIIRAIPGAWAGFGFFMLLDIGFCYGWIRLLQKNWEHNIVAVTNQRVLFQETQLFVHETRIEAPLNAILSVATETSQLGRMLKYGNVVARTFAGAINLPMVMYPEQVASFLELQWGKTKTFRSRAEAASMDNIVRTRLGYASKGKPPPSPSKPVKSTSSNAIMRGTENLLANLFQLKVETASGVIYKTHWIVLFQRTVLPLILFISLFILLMGSLFNLLNFPGGPYSALTFGFLLILILIGVGFWIWLMTCILFHRIKLWIGLRNLLVRKTARWPH